MAQAGPTPHPPILLEGGAGPVFLKQLTEYADGCLPIGGEGLEGDIRAMRDAATDAGRDPGELSIDLSGVLPDRGGLDHYGELGADRVALGLSPQKRFTDIGGATADLVMPMLDEYGVLAEQFRDSEQNA